MQECIKCHQEVGTDFKKSQHYVSANIFSVLEKKILISKEYSYIDVKKYCVRCHVYSKEYSSISTSENEFPCEFCHIREGKIIAGKNTSRPDIDGNNTFLPHKFSRVDDLSKSNFCKRCHSPGNDPGMRFIHTFDEWKSSRYAKKGIECQSCHMPNHNHSFRSTKDREFTSKAVQIKMDKVKIVNNELMTSITIKNIGVGHNFPTGGTSVSVIFQVIGDDEIVHERINRISGAVMTNMKATGIPVDKTRVFKFNLPHIREFLIRAKNKRMLRAFVRVEPNGMFEQTIRLSAAGIKEQYPDLSQDGDKIASQYVADRYNIFEKTENIDLSNAN